MKKIILTGDRPTGKLHIGHLFGSLNMRVKMQKEYDTYIMVADVQALTDNFKNPGKVSDNVLSLVIDNLSVGVSPKYSTIFIQSMIPEIAELTVFFSNLVTLARLQRNPTVKTEIGQKNNVFKNGVTYGFLGYPISQAADILIFNADVVPVGEDQLPMIEQTRDISRKFNKIYGDVFSMPIAKTSNFSRIRGLDGNVKMGKSLNNALYLSDSSNEIDKKVMKGRTDVNKIRKNDSGNPSICTIYSYHEIFNKEESKEIFNKCSAGELGCVDCKKCLIKKIVKFLEPIQEKQKYYRKNKDEVRQIIADGTEKARKKAQKTMKLVKKSMKIDYKLDLRDN